MSYKLPAKEKRFVKVLDRPRLSFGWLLLMIIILWYFSKVTACERGRGCEELWPSWFGNFPCFSGLIRFGIRWRTFVSWSASLLIKVKHFPLYSAATSNVLMLEPCEVEECDLQFEKDFEWKRQSHQSSIHHRHECMFLQSAVKLSSIIESLQNPLAITSSLFRHRQNQFFIIFLYELHNMAKCPSRALIIDFRLLEFSLNDEITVFLRRIRFFPHESLPKNGTAQQNVFTRNPSRKLRFIKSRLCGKLFLPPASTHSADNVVSYLPANNFTGELFSTEAMTTMTSSPLTPILENVNTYLISL